jgi:PleD family two-component response regulator
MTREPSGSAHTIENPVLQTNHNATHVRPVTLIANDQEWSARSLESVLSPRGFDVRRAFTGAQAIAVALEARPHLIILDAQMSDQHGFEVCAALRADPRIGPTTPIFVTTSGPAGRKERLAAYRAGVWEFFPEPLDLEIFLSRVERALETSLAVRAIEATRFIDPHTGLYSAEGLDHRARQLQAEAARQQQPVSCVVLRADPSGGVADSDTHVVERRRMEMVRAVRSVSREGDAVGEFGPGEFAIVAAGVTRQSARTLLTRYRDALAHFGEFRADAFATIAAGVATMLPVTSAPVDIVRPALAALAHLRQASDDGVTMEFSLG